MFYSSIISYDTLKTGYNYLVYSYLATTTSVKALYKTNNPS